MEEKNEQQVMRTVSDEELQQVSVVSILWATMSARSTGHRSHAFLSRNVAGTPARNDVLQAPCTLKGKGRGLRSSALSLIELSLSLVGAHFQKVKF